MAHLPETVARRVSGAIRERIASSPVVLIEGPRSVGKTTLLRELSQEARGELFDFDVEQTRLFAEANLSLITDGPFPVFIDEYQKVPELLSAIKAHLNRETRFGMYVLAGSTSFSALPQDIQSLTGRIQRIALPPFTQTELADTKTTLLADAFRGQITHSPRPSPTTRTDYVRAILIGGMPLALSQPSDTARARWFESYVRQIVERDLLDLRRATGKVDVKALIARLAASTARPLKAESLAQGLGVTGLTVTNNLTYLEALFLVSLLPAWGTTGAARVTKAPKIHVVDSGIAGYLMGLTPQKLGRRDPSALTEFGFLLESFVVQELVRMTGWLDEPVQAWHWRTRDGEEVDLILERHDGSIIAVEVKASDRVDSRSLGSLRRLRERLGDAFVAGIVFHLGQHGYLAEDRLHVIPVDRLWLTGAA